MYTAHQEPFITPPGQTAAVSSLCVEVTGSLSDCDLSLSSLSTSPPLLAIEKFTAGGPIYSQLLYSAGQPHTGLLNGAT